MSDGIPVIILLGPPGAGKGTQAANLSRERSIPRISTGDILRQAVQEDSELGRKVKEIMNKGALVDDQTMLQLVQDRISREDAKEGFVLDGYPRTMQQAVMLENVLPSDMRLKVVNIEVTDDEVVRRIAARRVCPNCHRIYNMFSHPPKKDEKCDVDGTRLLTRNDDTEEVIRKRLATYMRDTFPLVQHYQDKGALWIVNGQQPKEQITNEIIQICSGKNVQAKTIRLSPPYEGGD